MDFLKTIAHQSLALRIVKFAVEKTAGILVSFGAKIVDVFDAPSAVQIVQIFDVSTAMTIMTGSLEKKVRAAAALCIDVRPRQRHTFVFAWSCWWLCSLQKSRRNLTLSAPTFSFMSGLLAI